MYLPHIELWKQHRGNSIVPLFEVGGKYFSTRLSPFKAGDSAVKTLLYQHRILIALFHYFATGGKHFCYRFVSLGGCVQLLEVGPTGLSPFWFGLKSNKRESMLPNFKGNPTALKVDSHYFDLILDGRQILMPLDCLLCFIVKTIQIKEKLYRPPSREISLL